MQDLKLKEDPIYFISFFSCNTINYIIYVQSISIKQNV